MDTGIPPEWKKQWEQVVEQLRDPFKLRVTALLIVFAAGFLAVYRPINQEIMILGRQLEGAKDRLATIEKVDLLRARRARLRARIPQTPTINFWSEHLIGGVRESGVMLRSLETHPQKIKIGDLQAMYIDIEVEAQSDQLYHLVRWLEASKWMIRIIRFRFKKEPDSVVAKLTVAILVSQDKKHGA